MGLLFKALDPARDRVVRGSYRWVGTSL